METLVDKYLGICKKNMLHDFYCTCIGASLPYSLITIAVRTNDIHYTSMYCIMGKKQKRHSCKAIFQEQGIDGNELKVIF